MELLQIKLNWKADNSRLIYAGKAYRSGIGRKPFSVVLQFKAFLLNFCMPCCQCLFDLNPIGVEIWIFLYYFFENSHEPILTPNLCAISYFYADQLGLFIWLVFTFIVVNFGSLDQVGLFALFEFKLLTKYCVFSKTSYPEATVFSKKFCIQNVVRIPCKSLKLTKFDIIFQLINFIDLL